MSDPSCSGGRGAVTLSFEVMPPRHPELAPRFWGTVDDLVASHPDFLSVTYGAAGQDRTSARAVVSRLVRDTPVQPIAHLTCVGNSVDEVSSVVTDYLDTGVRTFLALRGDPPVDEPDWSPAAGGVSSATQLVALIRALEARRCSAHPGAALRAAFKPLTIAVAAFPGGNPAAGTTPEQEVERLLVKQAAGADFAITQLFWEPDTYVSFVERARACGVTIPVLAGLLPPTDPARLRRVTDLTGIEAPRGLLDRLSAQGDQGACHRVGVREGARTAREVLAAGAPGVHLYTFNRAAPALDLLQEAGLLDPVT